LKERAEKFAKAPAKVSAKASALTRASGDKSPVQPKAKPAQAKAKPVKPKSVVKRTK